MAPLLALALAACGGATQSSAPDDSPPCIPSYGAPPWDQGMSPPPQPLAQGDAPDCAEAPR